MDNDQFTCLFFLPAPLNVLNNPNHDTTQMWNSCRLLNERRPPLFPLFFFLTNTISAVDMNITPKMWVWKVKHLFVFFISHSIPHAARWWKKNHSVLSSVHHPVTPMVYEGFRDVTQRRIFAQAPQFIPWSQKSLLNGLLFRLAYSFQPQLRTMIEQHTTSVFWGAFELLKSAIWPSVTVLLPPFSMGSHHSQIPPNLVSVVLESLFSFAPPCSITFHSYHAVSDPGLMGKKTGRYGKDW